MPVVQAAVFTFAAISGTGTLPLDHVCVDEDGNEFIPTTLIFESAYAALNTLTQGGVFIGGYSDFRGLDTGTIRGNFSSSGAYSPFNFKATDSGQSLGDYSIIDLWTDNFGSGELYRKAKVTNKRLGGFDVQFDQNDRTGDAILCTAIGGDGLDVTYTNTINGAYATPSKPQGLISIPVPSPAASGGTSVGTGTGPVPWGFATRDGAYGTSTLFVVNQGSNFSVQLTSGFSSALDGFGNLGAVPIVSLWDLLAVTYANGPASGIPAIFSGDDVRCWGGVITEGAPSFDPGIKAKLVLFMSTGYTASGIVQTPIGQQSRGWATPNAQIGFWTGEKTPGNVAPQYGARYLSNDSVIRLGTPNGASTVFTSVGAVSNISASGPVSLTWSATSGNGEQILVFVIGEELPPPPSLGMLITQLPIVAAYPYQAVSPLATGSGLDWVTPPPQRSRRGR